MTNVERRHGAVDTRPLPRAERRHGAPDTRATGVFNPPGGPVNPKAGFEAPVERRHGAVDTRTPPREQRRQGGPDPRVGDKLTRGLFRVNYYDIGGQPKTAFVVAASDIAAAGFLGVQNNSGVQVTRERHPVEVDGLDPIHAKIAEIPPVVAPPQFEPLSDAEIQRIRTALEPSPTPKIQAPGARPVPPPAPPAPK